MDYQQQYEEELAQYEEELRQQAMRQRSLEEAHRPAPAPAPQPSAQDARPAPPAQEQKELWHQRDLQRQAQQAQQAMQRQAQQVQEVVAAQQQQQQRQQQQQQLRPQPQPQPPQPQRPAQDYCASNNSAAPAPVEVAAPATATTNQHVKDYMRSLMSPTGAAPWPYNQAAKLGEPQDNLRDRQTAKGGESFGRVPHASSNRMFTRRTEEEEEDEPLAVVGGNLGTFDAESIRRLPARSQATVPRDDESAIPAAGRALRRDGGKLAWQAGKQAAAEVWSVDEPDANYSSSRYYGRTAAHKGFLDQGRPQVVGGNWQGPSAIAARQMTTPRDNANSPSPAVTPTDEADGKQYGRCQTAWDDRNTEGDFRVLGGGWVSEVDEQRKLPAKPTQFQPPSTAYSDVDSDSAPLTARGNNDNTAASSRTTPADQARLGSAMSEVLGLGGAFDLRASKGAPSWSDIKKNQPHSVKLPYGMGEENLQQPRYARRPSLAMEEKRLEQESELSILGATGGWMGPSTNHLPASAAKDAERDSLVALSRRARPLSAKPNEMRMRQSAVVRQEEALHERAAERDANTLRHRGECPWMQAA
jgi:hypothetical protein